MHVYSAVYKLASAQKYGPPAKTAEPLMIEENATCTWTAINPPADNPLTVISDILYDPSFWLRVVVVEDSSA
jgi:hypothetical protein